jgi:hypothetical protein
VEAQALARAAGSLNDEIKLEKESNSQRNPGDSGAGQPAPIDSSQVSEDQALATLQRADVAASELASLARNPAAVKSRKVVLALVQHARTPRHISIPLLRRMFTFDLMQVTLAPAVAADLKRVAEDQILVRLQSLAVGEKISLARRASGRVAAGLLQDADSRVITAALDNSRLTEISVAAALAKVDALQELFNIVSTHPKWSERREVQIALLGSDKTPINRARELAANFRREFLEEIVPAARQSELL